MTPTTGDPGELRRRRREIARRHHPDLGGDREAFIAAMAALEAPVVRPGGAPGPDPAASAPIVVTRTARRRASAAARRQGARLLDGLRTRLPRRLPGARRYGRL